VRSDSDVLQESFDATVLDQLVNIEFNRVIEWHRENYGADADGNRGVMTTFIDNDYATDICITHWYDKEGAAQRQIVRFADLEPEMQGAVRQVIDEYLAKNDPEPTEDSGPPEPEYEPDMEMED
jgi:hypothetical protein